MVAGVRERDEEEEDRETTRIDPEAATVGPAAA